MRERLKAFARGIALGGLSAGVVTAALAAPASARPLRRDVIVAYSEKYWNKRGLNGPYDYFSNNCTNFVSQSWLGADPALPLNQRQYGGPDLDTSLWFPGKNAWSVAQAFVNYQNSTGPGYQKVVPFASGTTATWTRLTQNQTPGSLGRWSSTAPAMAGRAETTGPTQRFSPTGRGWVHMPTA